MSIPALQSTFPKALFDLVAVALGTDCLAITSTRRYRAVARRGVRTATRHGMVVVAAIALFDGLVLSPLHPSDAPLLVAGNLALAALAFAAFWLVGGALRRRPEEVAFVVAYAALLVLLTTTGPDGQLGVLAAAYLVLLPCLVALVVPWTTQAHVLWLALYAATTFLGLSALPDMLMGSGPARIDFLVVMVAAVGASVVGHTLLLRARVRAYAHLTRIGATERALRTSERQYRMLVEQASDAIFISDERGRQLDVNVAACTLLGYTREEMLALSVPDIWPPAANPGQAERVAQLRAGRTVVSERHVRRKDGTLVTVETSAGQLPDGRFHSIVRDISARKAAEAERDRLAAAVEQATDLVLMTDAAGRIVYVNSAFTTITAYSPADAIGRRVADLLEIEPETPGLHAAMEAALARCEAWAGHTVGRWGNDCLVDLDVVLSPVRDSGGANVGAVLVGRDVSHERALEKRLRQSQKMEAVGRLAGGVAHDFNNLLGAIRGFAELSQLGTQPDDEVHEFAGEIIRAADRAKLLTQRLLTFARQQPPSSAVIDLNQVASSLMPMLRQIVDERTRLTMELAAQPAFVRLDGSLFEQAVLNLIINARDAIATAGAIRITTRLETVDAAHRAARAGLLPGAYAVLSVADTGSGIATENLPLIFEPFFTTKPANQGTGLGLSIVYSVVTGAGGMVLVDSSPGSGSIFDLLFPLADEPASLESTAAIGSGRGPAGGETILLVEDEEALRTFVTRLLNGRGYRVQATDSAESAIALMEEGGPPPSLVITDVLLPNLSGPELADLLRRRLPCLPVLFVSGYDGNRLAADGCLDAATAFLAKPFRADELLQTVRRILDAAAAAA